MATKIEISNYRNIGNGDESAEFYINRGNKTQGDLSIIIGPGNSGKSGLLEAIYHLNLDVDFSENDIPYSIDSSDNKPIQLIYTQIIDDKKSKVVIESCYTNIDKERDCRELTNKELSILGNEISVHFNQFLDGNYEYPTSIYDYPIRIDYPYGDRKNYKCIKRDDFINWLWKHYSDYSQIDKTELYKELNPSGKVYLGTEEVLAKTFLEDNKILPKVYKYNEYKFKDEDFICQYKDTNNLLLGAIVTRIGQDPNKFDSSYIIGKKQYWDKRITDITKKICKEFNSIFTIDNYSYEFYINLDSQSLNFEINKKRIKESNEEQEIVPMKYSLQSSGFKWFFNFYFGFLLPNSKKLNSGDILLMDEPANNLSYASIKDLRKILKNFAKDRKIQIVIVTHNPAWIDIDYLEEIREVYNPNISLKINNNFNRYFEEKQLTDSLSNLARSVEANPNHLVDNYSDVKFILVEGTTDYMYLTTAKLYKDNKEKFANLCFIPINGVGKTKEEQEKIFNFFNKLYAKNSYVFLTDSDANGKSFCENNSKAINLASLLKDDKVTEIESLLSKEDINEFNLNKKHWIGAYDFKQHYLRSTKIENTKSIDNLTKALEKIQEYFE